MARPYGPPRRSRYYRRNRLGISGPRAAFLGLGPTAWYDARDLTSTTQQTIPNRVGSGTAQRGSTGGSDTNDPLVLTHATNYIAIPGGSLSNTVTVSAFDQTAANVTSIRLRRVNPATPPDTSWAQGASASPDIRWYGYLNNSNAMGCYVTNDATAGSTDVPIGTNAALGTAVWLRWDFNWTAKTVAGYYSTDTTFDDSAVSWTTVTADVAMGVDPRHPASTTAQIGGQSGTGTRFNVSRYVIRLDGTKTVDLYPSAESVGQTTWTCTTGQTITIGRATSGLTTAVVTRPLVMFDGTDDYLQLQAGDTPTFTGSAGECTWIAAIRAPNTPASNRILISASSSGSNQVYLAINTSGKPIAVLHDGTTTVAPAGTATVTGTSLVTVAMVVTSTNIGVYSSVDGSITSLSRAAIGTLTFTTPRVGTFGYAVASTFPGEIVSIALVKEKALTAAQLNTASGLLLGTYS